MPPKRRENRWDSLVNTRGFIYERCGNCWIKIGTEVNCSLGIPFVPRNKTRARQILDEAVRWVNSGLKVDIRAIKAKLDGMPAPPVKLEGVNDVLPRPGSVTTCFDLFRVFAETHFQSMSKPIAGKYTRVFNFFIPEDIKLSDTQKIRFSVSQALQKSQNCANYKRQQLKCIRKIFRFGFEEGYISKHPIPKSMMPKSEKVKYRAFTQEEIDIIIKSFSVDRPMLAELVLFLRITGARISEALSIKWIDVAADNHIKIRGKGGINRQIPIIPGSDLSRLLKRIEPYKEEYNGGLFPWPNNHTTNSVFRERLRKLGLHEAGKGFHAIRRFSENDYMDRGMPEREAALLFGHSQEVQRRHYREKKELESLRASLESLKKSTSLSRTIEGETNNTNEQETTE